MVRVRRSAHRPPRSKRGALLHELHPVLYSSAHVMRDGGHGRSRTCILSSVYGSPVRSRRRLRAHDARLAPVAGFEPAAAWLTARSTHPVRLTGMIWWTDRVLPPAPVACKASVQPSARPEWCLVVVSSHALRVFGAALSPDQLTRRIGADGGNRNRVS